MKTILPFLTALLLAPLGREQPPKLGTLL